MFVFIVTVSIEVLFAIENFTSFFNLTFFFKFQVTIWEKLLFVHKRFKSIITS